MGTVYSQNWSLGQGTSAMTPRFYRSSNFGGSDVPDALYPELKISEAIKVRSSGILGPGGEKVLDLDNSVGEIYTDNAAYFYAIGRLSSPSSTGWWNATQGDCTVQWYAPTAAFITGFYCPLLSIGTARLGNSITLIAGDPDSSGSPTRVQITLQAFRFNVSNLDDSTYIVNRSGTVGGVNVEGAWHTFRLVWQCGTANFSGLGTVANDGYLKVYWNGVLIYDYENIDLYINNGFDETSVGGFVAGTNPTIANWAKQANLGYYGFWGFTTNLLIKDSLSGGLGAPVLADSVSVSEFVSLSVGGDFTIAGLGQVICPRFVSGSYSVDICCIKWGFVDTMEYLERVFGTTGYGRFLRSKLRIRRRGLKIQFMKDYYIMEALRQIFVNASMTGNKVQFYLDGSNPATLMNVDLGTSLEIERVVEWQDQTELVLVEAL